MLRDRATRVALIVAISIALASIAQAFQNDSPTNDKVVEEPLGSATVVVDSIETALNRLAREILDRLKKSGVLVAC